MKYTNINLALYDAYKFQGSFVSIILSGKESEEKVQEVYDYMSIGIIKSDKPIPGVKCNKLILKKAKKYVPTLTRTEDGLLALPYKRYNPRHLKIENGKLLKNIIISKGDLKVSYKGHILTIPPVTLDEQAINTFKGIAYDYRGELISNPTSSDILDIVTVPKNVILKSEEDYQLYEQYKEKLQNTEVNSDSQHAINVYMTSGTFNQFNDLSKISVFPPKVAKKMRYLQNSLSLSAFKNKDHYYFKLQPVKPVYSLGTEKQYIGAEPLPSNYKKAINDSILIFDDMALARNYRDYFATNTIIIDNDKGYRSPIANLGLHEYSKNLYVTKSDAYFINEQGRKVKKVFRPVEYEGTTYYQLKGYYVNNIDEQNVAYWPGMLGGGYLLKTLPNLDDTTGYFDDSETYNATAVPTPADRNKYCEQYQVAICEGETYSSTVHNVAYIFDMKIDGNDIVVNVFHHGYRNRTTDNILVYNREFEITECKEASFYSKTADAYAQNFETIRFKNTSKVKFGFKNNGQVCDVRAVKFLRTNIRRNDLYISINSTGSKITITPSSDHKQSKYEMEMATSHTESYLFMDRGTSAGDNGEHIYRHYLHNDKSRTHYYVLSKDSSDWDRLHAEGFNLVEYLSDEHKQLFLTADKVVTSHLAARIFNPFYPSMEYNYLFKSKLIFLQHGITIANHRSFLDRYSKPLNLMICGAVEECEQVAAFSEYPNVKCTGFSRFDRLLNKHEGYILYAPSWNTIYRDNFVGSAYHQEVQNVLSNQVINDILVRNNLRIKLLLHPEFIKFSEHFIPGENVDIIKPEEVNYNKFISEADMLITDYSSLYFDFLYQKKHVILHQPYELHNTTSILKKPEECVRKSFDIKQLASYLLEIESLHFETDKEQQILEFFGHIDKNNCSRIMTEIEALDEEVKI